ncbi:hypothetical protein KDA_71170 [Dictyobacter alpinus]|uniref:Peptidase S54 rhomboid domain-containing protein n=1 Tax=Dictyobacter alpinus TaxID=2014873 RepID=A0A402BJW6_9CHLR|nr:rhomboid family intramembrane serine protease [Dictyobacter alpinus]GCE31633.1 hypothetical protein KDA_71170 [Dictyobacter alpinus]
MNTFKDNSRNTYTHNDEASQKKPTRLNLRQEIALRPLPFLPLLVILLSTIFVIWMQFSPVVLQTLQRDPHALAAGQWWRILSPLLVDSDGWVQLLTVSIGFICVGIPAQHWLGWWRWLLLFCSGALAGEIMGYLWQPYGGGNSIALFGLMGGMLILLLRSKEPQFFLPVFFAIFEVSSLIGQSTGSIWISIVLWIVGSVLLRILSPRAGGLRLLLWLAIVICLIGVISLSILHDIHGIALLAGMVVGGLLSLLSPVREAQM